MILRHANRPHDSRAETLAEHRTNESIQSLAEPMIEAIRDGLTPDSPESLRAKLWPSLPPKELREERGLWEDAA